MNKKDIINFSPEEAFNHGKKAKESGKSIHYNPYRNTDFSDSELFTSWVLGWKFNV
jgi:ribosome modulation factor